MSTLVSCVQLPAAMTSAIVTAIDRPVFLITLIPMSFCVRMCLINNPDASFDRAFEEPHLIDVDAQRDIEIVLSQQRVGMCLTMLPLNAEVNHSLTFGGVQTETKQSHHTPSHDSLEC